MLLNENRLPEPEFLRVKVGFCYRNRTRHQLWISYLPNVAVENALIRGYYCTCMTGARTLGTCVHVTSVLWYLGYARHNNDVNCPSQELIHTIADAADRSQQENPL